jgi:hypothetical protein
MPALTPVTPANITFATKLAPYIMTHPSGQSEVHRIVLLHVASYRLALRVDRLDRDMAYRLWPLFRLRYLSIRLDRDCAQAFHNPSRPP